MTRADLDLSTFDPAAIRPAFWYRLPPFKYFTSELRLEGVTAEAIRSQDARHLELLRHHGAAPVLRFYDRELLPAADRLPTGAERSLLRLQLTSRALAITAAAGGDAGLIERGAAACRELAAARLAKAPEEDRRLRGEVRSFLASLLAAAVERLERGGREREALRGLEILERLGPRHPERRAAAARLRWRAGDRSPQAIACYLRALTEDTLPELEGEPIRDFLDDRLAVDEELVQRELSDRLFFNLLALSVPRPPTPAWRNAGLAYLRLGQPARSIPYLEQAQARNGSDSGATAFYLGQALFKTEAFPASAAAFERAMEAGYSRLRIAAWLGVAHARARAWEKAEEAFQQAETAAGEVPESEFYLQWGRASFMRRDFTAAAERFRRAAALDADDPRALYGLALSLEQQGLAPAASELLQETVGRWPEFAPAAHRLGLLLLTAGEAAEGLRHLRRAVDAAPEECEYRLSLGLALDEAGDPEALPHLEWAGRAGIGGAEVCRRLALTHFRHGDRQQGRHWLAALHAAADSAATGQFLARDQVSQATECFNASDHQRAAELWEEATSALAGGAEHRERFARVLAWTGLARLRAGDPAGAGELLARAYALAPEAGDCRFLYAVGQWARGDFDGAAELLHGLADAPEEHPAWVRFLTLVSALVKDGAGEEELTRRTAEASGRERSAWLLLRTHLALERRDFAAATATVDAWVADGEALWGLELSRLLVGSVVVFAKLRASQRKRQRVIGFLAELSARDGEESWSPARLLARHALAVAKGLARAGEAESEEVAECERGYREFLVQAPTRDRASLLPALGRLLRFTAVHHLQQGRLAAALAAVERIEELDIPLSPVLARLAVTLRERLARPSHEQAYALLDQDPEAARQTWQTLLDQTPNDLLARHHLACLAWCRAWDAVLTGDLQASLPFWREGLEAYRQLYARDACWQALREKGRTLGASAAHRFDEAAFDRWREEAVYLLARTVLELIFDHLAGFDLTARRQKVDPRLITAASLLEVLRTSKLENGLVERLADELADHYLDPDPTRVRDFATSRRRAETVVDIDPENFKARTFLLRSATCETDVERREGGRDFSQMAQRLASLERHAHWLEGQLDSLPQERRAQAVRDLVAFYDQRGLIAHFEGQKATDSFNSTARNATPQQVRLLLEKVQQSYRQSDALLEKSLALDPVNPEARERLQHHQSQYPPLEEQIHQIHEIERHTRIR